MAGNSCWASITSSDPAMRRARRWRGGLLGLMVTTAALLSPHEAAARDPAPRFSLVWEVNGVSEDPQSHDPVTHARFTLRNTGTAPIPAGWTLWFTAIGNSASASSAFPVERVTGSLFRLHPAQAPALAPGQAVSFGIEHPGEVLRDDKGPKGPYLVLAADPGKGIAPQTYSAIGPRRQTPGVPASLFTDPAQTWQANQAWQAARAEDIPPLLPSPKAWRLGPAAPFAARLAPPRLGAGLESEAARARALAGGNRKAALPFAVNLGAVPGETSPEAYRLTISRREGVRILANSPAGAAQALASLEQLGLGGTWRELEITDAPRFAHRGMMLDLARNFRRLDEIEQVLDAMARLKLNKLHLHLADDEGWRIEIPALPELTGVGARRGHAAEWTDRLPPAVGSGPSLSDPHGSGFLTGPQYIALLRYAKARHIEVIPEIDMPGHMRAAVKAMEARARAHPEENGRYLLSDPADKSRYHSAQGYTDNVGDPGLASFDNFLDVVLAELVRLHTEAGTPLTRMHVGADEAPAGAWSASPAAQARMAALGKPGSRAVLWDDFFERVSKVLTRHGLAMAGWEELGMVSGAPSPAASPHFAARNVSVQVWNTFEGSEGLGNRLANAGYKVVLSPASHLYLDMVQLPDPAEPGHDWVAPLSMEKLYGYDPERPEPKGPALTETGRGNLLGIEATLFSETVRGPDRLGYMIFPRLIAVAERAWAPRPAWALESDPARAAAQQRASWGAFSRTLGERTLPLIERRFPAIAYRLPAPGLIQQDDKVLANYAWPGVSLRYTRDGSLPTPRSPAVTGPLEPGGRITVAAFTATGRISPAATIETQP